MENTGIQGLPKNESGEQIRIDLARYLEQQPESKRTFHKVMKVLEFASMGISVAVCIAAIVVSFYWKQVPAGTVPGLWLLFPASVTLLMLCAGVHTLGLRAFPASGLGGNIRLGGMPKPLKLATGRAVQLPGWLIIAAGLINGAFWGTFSYAAWTVNMLIVEPMAWLAGTVLGVLLAVGITVKIIYSIYQKVVKAG